MQADHDRVATGGTFEGRAEGDQEALSPSGRDKTAPRTCYPGGQAYALFSLIIPAAARIIYWSQPILAELEKAGVKDENITLLCATGMHRISTREEKVTKLGAGIVKRLQSC